MPFIFWYNFGGLQNLNLPIFIPCKVIKLPTFSRMLRLRQFAMLAKIKPTSALSGAAFSCCFFLRIFCLTIVAMTLCFTSKQTRNWKNKNNGEQRSLLASSTYHWHRPCSVAVEKLSLFITMAKVANKGKLGQNRQEKCSDSKSKSLLGIALWVRRFVYIGIVSALKKCFHSSFNLLEATKSSRLIQDMAKISRRTKRQRLISFVPILSDIAKAKAVTHTMYFTYADQGTFHDGACLRRHRKYKQSQYNLGRPSECHFINVHMFAYRCSSGRSISWHHVYYSRWKTSLWSKNMQRCLRPKHRK